VRFLLIAGCWVASTLLLTNCQPGTQSQPEQPTAQPTAAVVAAAEPVASPAPAPPAAPYTGYHRYCGTVGGRPVLLELLVDSSHNFSIKKGLRCEGSYFYERLAGGDIILKAPEPYRPGQPLRLLEDPTGTWQATQPLGPVLSGTWTSRAGRRLPFVLREDYHDAVRYEILTTHARGPACPPDPELPQQPAAWQPFARLSQEYLHLLGPDTLRPALRRLQCPLPARRRALTRVAARELDCNDVDRGPRQTLNAYGLLNVWEDETVNEYNGGRPHGETRPRLYDLRAGRWLTLAELLRPRADSLHLLEQLAARHLLREEADYQESQGRQASRFRSSDTTTVALPQCGVGFSSQGLVLSYEYGEVAYNIPGSIEVTIAYSEVLPLLRPSTPLARMLRERGIWR
jgi:hypothetical protein